MFHHTHLKRIVQLRIIDSAMIRCFLRDSFIRSFSRAANSRDESSSTISYLMKTCGLSEKVAVLVAKQVSVKSEERSDLVLETFRSFGFTNDQIARLISKNPRLLSADPVNTIKPKLEFYQSIGFSEDELTSLVSKNGFLLARGLKTVTIPSYNYLKSYFQRSEDIVACARKSSWFLHCNLQRLMEPNIRLLRSIQITEPRLLKFITQNLRKLCTNSLKFKENVELVIQMGVDPSTPMFLKATEVLMHLSQSSWKRKMEFYMSLGWSEDQVIYAFKRHPYCMLLSETKIKNAVEFFESNFGMKPTDLYTFPVLLSYSMDKRILPRYMVIRSLMSKGILRRDLRASSIFSISEKNFFEKYVIKNEEKIPGLLTAYKAKIDILKREDEI